MIPIAARMFCHLQEALWGRNTFSVLKDLKESQYWPREKIKELQLERLRKLVSGAYAHTSYWKTLMDESGILPESIKTLEDLKRFPLLEKETLRARKEDMVWRDEGRRLQFIRTSGSTNEALQFYTNSNREAQINAARIRGHEWVGVKKHDKEVYFWGSPAEVSKHDRMRYVRDFFVNDGFADGLELTPGVVSKLVKQWKRYRPKCLFGYPCSFVFTAQAAEKANIDLKELKNYGLEVICTTSEVLTDLDREVISNAFGIPVCDSYGLKEAGLIGHECTHQTMHTMDEQIILETIDPVSLEPTTGEGELVVTSLISNVMPIIRYRTGDVVTLSDKKCECGLSLNSIKISGGRIADFLVNKNGTWIAGYSFIYICRTVPGVVKFQVRQEEIGKVKVLLAVDEHFPPDGKEQVKEKMRKRLKSDDEIMVEIVDDIKPAPSGKYRPVVSKVSEGLRGQ